MNVTEQLIRMCERAREVQKLWKPEKGDICCNTLNRAIIYLGDVCFKNYIRDEVLVVDDPDKVHWESLKEYFGDSLIWIPTQSQLQGILIDKEHFRFSLIEGFYHFANKNIQKFTSMEQLWLAYVMETKFGKVWNGRKWVKRRR